MLRVLNRSIALLLVQLIDVFILVMMYIGLKSTKPFKLTGLRVKKYTQMRTIIERSYSRVWYFMRINLYILKYNLLDYTNLPNPRLLQVSNEITFSLESIFPFKLKMVNTCMCRHVISWLDLCCTSWMLGPITI